MGRRGVGSAIIALLAVAALVTGGCGGPDTPAGPTGSDAGESAPPEAQNAIVQGLQTMFTWFPATDASTMDAYNRALPFLDDSFRAGAANRLERGNSVWWQEWKAEGAKVDAAALLVAGEHPVDQPDTVVRSVLVTQTVSTPDGTVLDENVMRIERVVARKGPQGWRVSEINYFPENEYRTQVCPPGQSHQPAPDGPCAPNPPPPPKLCPDGSSVAPDQVCPAPRSGPQTSQCPDGTTVAAGAACPSPPAITTTTTGPAGEVCPDGTTMAPGQTCPTASTTPTTPTTEAQRCPDGSTVSGTQTCTPPTECPDGSTVYAPAACPAEPVQCPGGSTAEPGQLCPSATSCWDGSTVYAPQSCPPAPVQCPGGGTVPAGQLCPSATSCWDGSTVYAPTDCPSSPAPPPPPPPPPPPVAASCTSGTPGGFGPVCTCPSGYDLSSANMCVVSTGAGPVVRFRSQGARERFDRLVDIAGTRRISARRR